MRDCAAERTAWLALVLLLLGSGVIASRPAGDARGALSGREVVVPESAGGRVRERVEERRGRFVHPGQALLAAGCAVLFRLWSRLPGDHCAACGVRLLRPGVCGSCGTIPVPIRPFAAAWGGRGRYAIRLRSVCAAVRRAVLRRPLVTGSLSAALLGIAVAAAVQWRGALRSIDTLVIAGVVSCAAQPFLWRAAVRGKRDARCPVCYGQPPDERDPRCVWCSAERRIDGAPRAAGSGLVRDPDSHHVRIRER